MAGKLSDEDLIEERKMFNLLDKNQDGYITKREMKKGLKGMISKEQLEEIMSACDTD